MIPIITSRMLLLSLRHGLTDSSPYAFGAFGFSLAISGDIDGAFQFGSIAIRMMERLGEDARTLVMVYGLFYHIKRPILDGLKPTLRAYYVAFAQGDMAFSGQAIAMHLISRMVAGLSLENIIADTFSFCDQLKAYNQSMMWNVLLILQRGNLELANRSDEIAKLTGEIHDDDAFVSYLLGFRVDYFDFQYSLFTLRSRFYLEDEESTHMLAEKFWNFKGVHGPYCHSVLYFLFSALVALECWKKAGVTQRFRFWRLFRKFQRLLTAWTKKGDPNTLHLVYLLDAEVVATKKNVLPLDVQRMYHQSISQARRVGFIQDAALANERLGEYFLSKQDHDWAQYYLQNAKVLYYDWGAKKKVQQMEKKYGELVEIKVTEDDLSKSLTGRARQEIISDIDEIRARTRVSLRENRIISVSA
jgi:histidine kinase